MNVFSHLYDFLTLLQNQVWLDWVLVFSLGAILATVITAIILKLTSFDCDVIFSSKTMLKYLDSPKTIKSPDAISYKMRMFPTKILWAYQSDVENKNVDPMDALKSDLVEKPTICDRIIETTLRFVCFIVSVLSVATAFIDTSYTLSVRLLLPLVVITFALLSYNGIKLYYYATKKRAIKLFNKLVSALSFRYYIESKRLEAIKEAACETSFEEDFPIVPETIYTNIETENETNEMPIANPIEVAKESVSAKIDEVIAKIENAN